MNAVLAALGGIVSGNPGPSEAALRVLAQQDGFAALLAQIAGAHPTSVEEGIRQAAAVVLKNHAKAHWDPDSRAYVAPEVPEPEKAQVRMQLLHALGDPSSKVRTAVGMAIVAIQEVDYPHAWPDVISSLVQLIQEGSSDMVQGALRCLAMMSSDIDERQLPEVVPALLPALCAIASSPQCTPAMQRSCLTIVHGLVSVLGTISGAFQRQVRDLLEPLLRPWLPLLSQVLSAGVSVQDPSSWGLQMIALKTLIQLVLYFAKFLTPSMPSVLSTCWHLFTAGHKAHQEGLVEGAADELDVDTDVNGDTVDLEALLSQMFELLLTILGNPRFSVLLKPACKEMVYVAIGYMQMTASQTEEWSSNANQYVADDEDAMFTARVSGELLLDQAFQAFGREAVAALLEAVERRTAEASHARAATLPTSDWWRMREAALLALGGCAAHLEAAASGSGGVKGAGAAASVAPGAVLSRVQEQLQAMLTGDLQAQQGPGQGQQGPGQLNPFLAGRALWAASKLVKLMAPGQVQAFMQAAIRGIHPDLPAPVRIGACRVLTSLIPRCSAVGADGAHTHIASPLGGGAHAAGTPPGAPAWLVAVLPGLYEGLLGLLASSSEETLHLVLQTLTVVLKQDRVVVPQLLPQISLPVLHIWSSHVADPLLSADALEVLQALAGNPQCLEPLATQVLPTLAQVVGHPEQQPPMLVEGCLDLMRSLLQPGSKVVAAAVYQLAGPQVLTLLSEGTDAGMLQGAVEMACDLVHAAGPDLPLWPPVPPPPSAPPHTAPTPPLQALLSCCLRLLSPSLEESQSVFVGSLLLDLLQHHAGALAPMLPTLLDGVVSRLVASNMMPLVSGLLLALSKMALMDAKQLVSALAERPVTLPSGASVPALDAVLPMWLERARDTQQGRFRTALCATALVALLETEHPRLHQIRVKGRLLDVGGGVRTRSQAAAAANGGEAERARGQAASGYASVPASVGILAALAEILADLQEEKTAGREVLGLDGELWGDEEEGEEDEEDEEGEEDGEGLRVTGASFGAGQQQALEAALRQGSTRATTTATGAESGGSGLAAAEAALAALVAESEGDDGEGEWGSCSGQRVPGSSGPDDPLVRLDVGQYVRDALRKVGDRHGAGVLQAAAAEMTPRQAKALMLTLTA